MSRRTPAKAPKPKGPDGAGGVGVSWPEAFVLAIGILTFGAFMCAVVSVDVPGHRWSRWGDPGRRQPPPAPDHPHPAESPKGDGPYRTAQFGGTLHPPYVPPSDRDPRPPLRPWPPPPPVPRSINEVIGPEIGWWSRVETWERVEEPPEPEEQR